MRLDKFLCETSVGSRSQVKGYLKKGMVTVNGQTVTKPEQQIREDTDVICFQNRPLHYQKYRYYMLNKPAGVVSATKDNTCKTVLDLLEDKEVCPVGRLDKDTEGLLLLTNDGELSHNLLSPRKHVPKKYQVTIREVLSTDQISQLEMGVEIGEKELTKPAIVEVSKEEPCRIYLTITEGKFHQVKRMLLAVENEVLHLKRLSMGSLVLDEALAPGMYRSLTEEELNHLKSETN